MVGEINGKYIIEYTILTKEPLAIGGSTEMADIGDVDRPVIKTADGIPYIPGSSLRGTIRTYFDRIGHVLSSEYSVNISHASIGTGGSIEDDVCDVAPRSNLKQFDLTSLLSSDKICDLCLCFGAKGYGSPLLVSDAYPVAVPHELEVNTHIKIDRGSDTAQRGALFSVEAVPKDTLFHGKIIYEKRILDDKDREEKQDLMVKLLVTFLHDKDIYLGGVKSRGYGHCYAQIENLYDLSVRDVLLGTDEADCRVDVEDFISSTSA